MKTSLRSGALALAVIIASLSGARAAAAQVLPWVALPDGDLDPRFGRGGIVATVGPVAALQSDGKIVVAGAGLLARHNVDGSLDESFGIGGIVATEGGRAITTQPDDRLLALSGEHTLLRYNRDGSLDTNFGTGGRVTTPGRASSFALASDGRIVVALADGAVRVVRYGPSGILDPTFGIGGAAAIPLPSAALVIQPDGKIVGVGDGFGPTSLRQDFMVVRLHANGSPDTGFGNNGVVYTDFGGRIDHGTALLELQDGRIVAGGSIGTNRPGTPFDFGLARYLDDGSLDGTFGFGGVMTTTIGGPFNTSGISRMALHTDGKIVAAGTTMQPLVSPPDLALVRYHSNGTVDNAFGIAGVVTTDIGGTSDSVSDVLLQPDGKIVAAAFASATPDCECASTYLLTRYTYDAARGVFGGPLRTIPAHIEAEDYDLGGQGTGYFDTTSGAAPDGFLYRTDEVDIKASNEGGLAIGWLNAGEWLAYTVDVEHDGLYTVNVRVGSALPGRSFHLELDGRDVTGGIPVPDTGSWGNYGTVSAPPIRLAAGRQVLRLVMGAEDWMDFDSLDISEAAAVLGGSAARASIPGLIEAEDYDPGGQGIGYSDTTPGNEQGVAVYRRDDVDIKGTADGGHAVGWLAAGEWLAYTVEAESAGVFTIQARVGSALPGRTFRLQIDGVEISGPVAVPVMSGWDQFATVRVAAVALRAGVQVVRVLMGPADFMDFDRLEIVQ